MENVILIAVLVAILGGAIAYIVRAKKRGVKCIGCSACGICGAKKGGTCGGCSGCACESNAESEKSS
ncbi:MAG: FeoB-associated Cys-rich membrane protein [Lachnospiraceae bacterium]|nr:FeoB-associated Cys-rich membrane protein [Lachnospiraceae bacterium]